ncbi:Chloroperoxidase [Mycena latifolia]|nr:Chloroperoxidase [Mycena latifolia]
MLCDSGFEMQLAAASSALFGSQDRIEVDGFTLDFGSGRLLGGAVSKSQLIDVAGAHAFVPPGPNDLRGPCPGLNALANHNYLPHNGLVPVLQAISVCVEVFGMGPDTAAIAGLLGLLYGGNLLDLPFLRFSIGGPPPSLLGGLLGGILGTPPGLSGTHNQFESDSSPTRCDLYECGDNHSLQPAVLQEILDMLGANPDPSDNLRVIFDHRLRRLEHSIANNPYFFYGPIEMLVSCLTHVFITGMMSNHSALYPGGFLSPDGLISLFGSHTASDGISRYIPGMERIPENWYRRAVPYLALPDLLALWTTYPQTLVLGGNTNGTDTFAPIDLNDFTGGVYSATRLLDGTNAACFAFQLAQLLVPDILNGVEAFLAGILAKVAQLVEEQILALACPELAAVKLSMLEQYPGYMKYAKRTTG